MTLILEVKVTPHASRNQFVSWEEGILRLRIKGVPEKGQVNAELVAFLAKSFNIPKANIQLVSGASSRFKRLKLEGITYVQLNAFLLQCGLVGEEDQS